jgi:hypothetical protein
MVDFADTGASLVAASDYLNACLKRNGRITTDSVLTLGLSRNPEKLRPEIEHYVNLTSTGFSEVTRKLHGQKYDPYAEYSSFPLVLGSKPTRNPRNEDLLIALVLSEFKYSLHPERRAPPKFRMIQSSQNTPDPVLQAQRQASGLQAVWDRDFIRKARALLSNENPDVRLQTAQSISTAFSWLLKTPYFEHQAAVDLIIKVLQMGNIAEVWWNAATTKRGDTVRTSDLIRRIETEVHPCSYFMNEKERTLNNLKGLESEEVAIVIPVKKEISVSDDSTEADRSFKTLSLRTVISDLSSADDTIRCQAINSVGHWLQWAVDNDLRLTKNLVVELLKADERNGNWTSGRELGQIKLPDNLPERLEEIQVFKREIYAIIQQYSQSPSYQGGHFGRASQIFNSSQEVTSDL